MLRLPAGGHQQSMTAVECVCWGMLQCYRHGTYTHTHTEARTGRMVGAHVTTNGNVFGSASMHFVLAVARKAHRHTTTRFSTRTDPTEPGATDVVPESAVLSVTLSGCLSLLLSLALLATLCRMQQLSPSAAYVEQEMRLRFVCPMDRCMRPLLLLLMP